ncbi:MAG: amino acid permease [Lachnospiraceae bacterium]|nr:amino acid permease [Lachnospiraceae bacterium]
MIKTEHDQASQNRNNAFGNGLRAGFTPLGIWAFSIGTSIGWGSFIVTCNTYLQKSGLLGTVIGLLLGMAIILVITWNLQYMIMKKPDAGGPYTFVKQMNSKDLGFVTFWFVLLTYLAIFWASITSLPLFARFFLGDTFRFGFHYHVFGYEVWLGEALLSICAVILIGLLCASSSRLPNHIMTVAALVFVAAFALCAVIAMAEHDTAFRYEPFYTEGSGAFGQIIRIAVISPWAFIGFENIAHFSEEYDFPVKRVRRILISSVFVTTILYLFVSALSVSAYPQEYNSWLAYIQDMGNLQGIKAVPAFYAADYYLGRPGVVVLMIALFGVILTSLIGNMLALSRLIYAAGREGETLPLFARLNARNIPDKAVLAVAVVSVFIPFLGRTAIGWIVDVTTLGATMIYGFVSYAVFHSASRENARLEKATGLAGVLLMICFILLLLIPGLLPFDAMETESYILFIVWAILGLIYFRVLIFHDRNREYGQRIVVWIILLMLVLFASMMWVSRETDHAAKMAVERIYEYHQSHQESDTDEESGAARVAFLHEQAKHVSSANTLYTLVSLGLFTICTLIMTNNYRDNRKLGRRLSAAEQEAREARRIAELKESISTLLDNMPALSYSKDAETGVYLACNQAFADYAHKESPEGVVGLAASEIFDSETAELFTREDRIALSMEEPYIVFEDVPDAAGNRKQLQTTKLKFIDASGKLCILGMSQDVTDMVRIQRENATTKEAYEKAKSNGIIFTHIAQTLAHGYEDLYYINIENGEYIEYNTDDSTGSLKEIRRGEDFFGSCVREAEEHVYSEDRPVLKEALNRDRLVEALNRNRIFSLTYRLLSEGKQIYVSMTVTRMDDDDRFIVLGVTDVDEEMKRQRAAERIMEEHIAYSRMNALTGDFLSVYVVDPETDRYREFSSSDEFGSLALPREGTGFFETSREQISKVIYHDDLERFLSMFTREGILSETEQGRLFTLSYRLMMNGKPNYVQLKAAMIMEKEARRLIVGINDIESQVQQEEDYARRLALAQTKANVDALTGVRNKHAYLDVEERLDQMIIEQHPPAFAIVILDVNDLKKINDTLGHQAGDQYIRDACKLICDNFKRSPVFRTGGDEFTAVVQGDDYEAIEELIGKMEDHNRAALQNGGIVIACGMARYQGDICVATVYERADQSMYENKSNLKARRDTVAKPL